MLKLFVVLVFALAIGTLALSVAGAETENSLEENVAKNETKLSKEVYQKCWSFMKHSRAFRNFTYQDMVNFLNDAVDFKPPEHLATRFPYYLAGYDFEDRPVWVAEAGKYKIDDLISTFIEMFPIYYKWWVQGSINIAKSFVDREKERPGKDIRQFVQVLDCEGFDARVAYKVLAHPAVINFGIKAAELYLDLGEEATGLVIIINANHAAKIAMDIARPVVGSLIDKLVVLGTNPYKWKGELRRYLPEETIPTWYGGSKDWKPLAVYY